MAGCSLQPAPFSAEMKTPGWSLCPDLQEQMESLNYFHCSSTCAASNVVIQRSLFCKHWPSRIFFLSFFFFEKCHHCAALERGTNMFCIISKNSTSSAVCSSCVDGKVDHVQPGVLFCELTYVGCKWQTHYVSTHVPPHTAKTQNTRKFRTDLHYFDIDCKYSQQSQIDESAANTQNTCGKHIQGTQKMMNQVGSQLLFPGILRLWWIKKTNKHTYIRLILQHHWPVAVCIISKVTILSVSPGKTSVVICATWLYLFSSLINMANISMQTHLFTLVTTFLKVRYVHT